MEPDFYITTGLMGYGHLRAADNVASAGRGKLVRVDRPPFAGPRDAWVWKGSQDLYHSVSRTVETRARFLFRMLERIEDIPEDSKQASLQYSTLVRLIVRLGVGRELRRLGNTPRLHTFFLPNLACVYNRFPGRNYQLLCDADFHRVWAPIRPNDGDVTYLVPTAPGADRLMSYGVARRRILVTGFPLPAANTGGRDLAVAQSDLRARLERLSPKSGTPLRLVFSFSGAGCYLKLLMTLISELIPDLRNGKLALTIAAGDNHKAKAAVERHLAELKVGPGNGVSILYSPDVLESFALFNRALRESDLLITKPGELVFYAALGMPQVLLPPVGKHEFKNRALLIENAAALDLPGASGAGAWLLAQRSNGNWRRAAESAYARLPKLGAFAVNDAVRP